MSGALKLAALLKRVREVLADARGKARVVIFSERIQTLEFLREVLVQECKLRWTKGGDKNEVETSHGTLDDTSQMALVRSFGLR